MSEVTPIITLLTDFGESDGYVGAMKGVMLGITPQARFVDISHYVRPQNIWQAARIIANVYPYYPRHAVHLIVVDPGVGSERNPIAVETPSGMFIAPDNGVVTPVIEQEGQYKAVTLDNTAFWRDDSPSHTFHGRDIFSPAAAHLAGGVPLSALGSSLEKLRQLEMPPIQVGEHAIRGEVIHIDHFGNTLTNIAPLVWHDAHTLLLSLPNRDPIRLDARQAHVTCGWHTLETIQKRYSEVKIGERLALVSSNRELEIAINQGNAAQQMDLSVGDHVTLHLNKQ